MFDLTDEISINLAFISGVETYLLGGENNSTIPAVQISMTNGNKYNIKGMDAYNFLVKGIKSEKLWQILSNKIQEYSSH